MRLIDADAIPEKEMNYPVWVCLKKQTTIDAVPVVRCKDCKHRKHLQGATDEAYVCGLGWGLRGIVAEEDFCSYGKRKDGRKENV